MTLNDLISKAAHTPDALTDDDFAELHRVARDVPASALAPAILLKLAPGRLGEAELREFRTRVALSGGMAARLIAYIDPAGAGFADFYPEASAECRPSTESAIDIFLETYGHQSPEEDALLERMIFNPVPDYAECLSREETLGAAVDRQDELIDAFLSANPVREPASAPAAEPLAAPRLHASPPPPPHAPDVPQGPLLSESLAKIFIKQGRYERAYEIITNLSLNYPEKSVYFADQLRFLEKLMINQRFAKGEK